jgi:hypothetical protein
MAIRGAQGRRCSGVATAAARCHFVGGVHRRPARKRIEGSDRMRELASMQGMLEALAHRGMHGGRGCSIDGGDLLTGMTLVATLSRGCGRGDGEARGAGLGRQRWCAIARDFKTEGTSRWCQSQCGCACGTSGLGMLWSEQRDLAWHGPNGDSARST